MQRRRVPNPSRRISTAIVSRLKTWEPNERGSDIFNTNIVIALPVNATHEELMRSLRQLLYTSWVEVTGRIAAAVPVIYHINDEEQTADEESFKTGLWSDETVLLTLLETHAEDDILIYDFAKSTLVADIDSSRSNKNLTCACNFYWKGFS